MYEGSTRQLSVLHGVSLSGPLLHPRGRSLSDESHVCSMKMKPTLSSPSPSPIFRSGPAVNMPLSFHQAVFAPKHVDSPDVSPPSCLATNLYIDELYATQSQAPV